MAWKLLWHATMTDDGTTPERTSEAAFALMLLRRPTADVDLLLRYNTKWSAFGLIGGHVEPEDEGQLERTAIREVHEETGLAIDSDFTLERLHDGVLEEVAFSRSARVCTRYRFALFGLRLSHPAWDVVSFWRDPRMYRWASRREIELGQTADGAPIAAFPCRLVLARFDLSRLPASPASPAGTTADDG